MKAFLVLLLLVGTTCFAQDTSGITNKVTQIDRDKDGKIDVWIETGYRGTTKVMMTVSRRNPQGVMTVSTRSYLAAGRLVAIEADEDGDGHFETLTVFGPDTDTFEMFTRQKDGSIAPLSSRELDLIRRQHAVANQALGELFDGPEKTEKEIGDLLEKSRQKVDAIKPPTNPKFEKFRREMLPQVGSRVTVVGKLDAGKLGWWLSSQEWGLYLYTTTTNRADLEKMNGLGEFAGRTVKVIGILRHCEHQDSGKPFVSDIPEHFYFDVAQVVISDHEIQPDEKAKSK